MRKQNEEKSIGNITCYEYGIGDCMWSEETGRK